MLARQLFTGGALSSFAALALGAAAACGDSASSGGGPGTNEGGTDTGAAAESGADVQVSNPNEAKQKGRVIDAISKMPVEKAVVAIAGKSVTVKDDGTYEIIVPRNAPYAMSVTGADHWKLDEQEWIVKTETFDRTDTVLLGTTLAGLLASFLPPRNPAKGTLVVRVYPLPPCTSEQGAKIAIEPAGASKITYFAAGKPDKTATSATKDENFSAAVSDVDTGVNIKVTVSSPACEQVAFPVDYQNVTYTGAQKTEPGDILSYIRVFIGPKKVADAGAD